MVKDDEEILDLVSETGQVIGQAPRSQCHGNPTLVHRAVHVFVLDQDENIFLQKRSKTKKVQPGKWDTSVGGHVDSGESYIDAAHREMGEELGITTDSLELLHQYLWRSPIETELVRTYFCYHRGPFHLNGEEIEQGRFFSKEELLTIRGTGQLTPNCEHELVLLGVYL